MPPLRRRRVGSQVNIGIGTLLADSERQRLAEVRDQETIQQKAERLQQQEEHKVDRAYVERERARVEEDRTKRENEQALQKAQDDVRAKEAARVKRYQQVYDDYKNGTASYQTTIDALQNAVSGGETNSDIRDQLKNAISGVKLIKVGRDIDESINDYNNGKIGYYQLKSTLESVKTDNDVLKSRISTSVAAARTTENTRLINKASTDYQTGAKTIDQVINDLNLLKNDPTQKNPADMDKISQAIQSSLQTKASLADQNTFSNWQTGAISDGEALAYFRARQATAKTPEDLKNITTALTSITQTAQKKGAAAAEAFDRQIQERTKQNHEAFKKELDKAVKLCDGDTSCVMRAYDSYGEFLKSQASLGGSNAQAYLDLASQSGTYGMITAATEERNKLLSTIDQLKKESSAKDIPIELYALKMGQIAALGQLGANSSYQTPGSRAEFLTERQKAAETLLARELELQREAEKQGGVSRQEIMGAYSALASSKEMFGAGGNSLIEALKRAGVTLDWSGSAADKAKFFDWMQQAPEDRANMVFDLLNPAGTDSQGQVKRPSDEARDKFVNDITGAVGQTKKVIDERTKILDTFVQIANPNITTDEKKKIVKIITETEKSDPGAALNQTKNTAAVLVQIRTEQQQKTEDKTVRKEELVVKQEIAHAQTPDDPLTTQLTTQLTTPEGAKITESEYPTGTRPEFPRPQGPPPQKAKIQEPAPPPQPGPPPPQPPGNEPTVFSPDREDRSSLYKPVQDIPVFDFSIGGGSGLAKIEQDLNTTPTFGSYEINASAPAAEQLDIGGIGKIDYPTFDFNTNNDQTQGQESQTSQRRFGGEQFDF